MFTNDEKLPQLELLDSKIKEIEKLLMKEQSFKKSLIWIHQYLNWANKEIGKDAYDRGSCMSCDFAKAFAF